MDLLRNRPQNSSKHSHSPIKSRAQPVVHSKADEPFSCNAVRPSSSQEIIPIGKGNKRSVSDSLLDRGCAKRHRSSQSGKTKAQLKLPFTIHEDNIADENGETQQRRDQFGQPSEISKQSDENAVEVEQGLVGGTWENLADQRLIALTEAMNENRALHETLRALKAENLRLTDAVAQVNTLTEFLELHAEVSDMEAQSTSD